MEKRISGILFVSCIVLLGVISAMVSVNIRARHGVILESKSQVVSDGSKQMLWLDRAARTSPGWINIDKPKDNFNWNYDESPACEDGCAWRDKVFTVDDWDKLCIQHCGNVDSMLAEVSNRQKNGVFAASAKSATARHGVMTHRLLAAGERLLSQVDQSIPRVTSQRHSQSLEAEDEGDQAEDAEDAEDKGGVKWSSLPWDERPMPEQHSDVPIIFQDWDTFWDEGTKLREEGVNVADNTFVPPIEVKHPEDRELGDYDHVIPIQAKAGVKANGWPWDTAAKAAPAAPVDGDEEEEAAAAASPASGLLHGVNLDGWDATAFLHMGPPPVHQEEAAPQGEEAAAE